MELATRIQNNYTDDAKGIASSAIENLWDAVEEAEAELLVKFSQDISHVGDVLRQHGFPQYSCEYELAKLAMMYERQNSGQATPRMIATVGLLASPDNIPIKIAEVLQLPSDRAQRRVEIVLSGIPELMPLYALYKNTLAAKVTSSVDSLRGSE